jgi:hypothetical protein
MDGFQEKKLRVFRRAICYINSFYDKNNKFRDLVNKKAHTTSLVFNFM